MQQRMQLQIGVIKLKRSKLVTLIFQQKKLISKVNLREYRENFISIFKVMACLIGISFDCCLTKLISSFELVLQAS
jgi:hypothetical protein